MRRFLKVAFCLSAAFVSMSCRDSAAEKKAPSPGDTVTPVIFLGKTWKQKGLVLVSVKLSVTGRTGAESRFLQMDEVPYDVVPQATLTFDAPEQPPQRLENVLLARDC